MREIKFRVWCEFEINGKIETSMEEPCSWFLLTQTGTLLESGPMRSPQPLNKAYKKVISLFYTGQKDKNNKEIYEGDIVKWFKEFDFVVGGCKEIEYANFQVVFEDSAFWLKEIDSDDPDERNNRLVRNSCEILWEKYDTPICEVIGNIYENLELMK